MEELGLVLEVGGSTVAPGTLGLFARLASGANSSCVDSVLHRCCSKEVTFFYDYKPTV